MGATVQNALSPEEKPIIENIISLFQQLLSMQEGQTATTEEVVEEAIGEEAEMEEVDVNKSVDGETGDDNAEKRIEEGTPITEESMQDLKKSIAALTSVIAGKQVTKSKVVKKSNTIPVLNEIAKVLKGIVEKQNAQEQFNANFMEAIGFTDEVVNKSLESTKPVKKDKPIQTLDTESVKTLLSEVLKSVPALNQNPEYRHPFNQKKEDRNAGLNQIVKHIHNAPRK